jgi:Ca2+-transporting ATPase
VHALRGREDLARLAQSALQDRAPVAAARVNAITGSVLVLFDPTITVSDIAVLLEETIASLNGADQDSERGCAAASGTGPERWHLLTAAGALYRTGTEREAGLSEAEAAARLAEHGRNRLPESLPRSGLEIFLSQFRSLPVGLLAGSAVASALTGGLADAAVIAGVLLINAVIGYATESQAEGTIDALRSAVRPSAHVIRDGRNRVISAEEVVPGDLLWLSPGSYVAADARLLSVRLLAVVEYFLTV